MAGLHLVRARFCVDIGRAADRTRIDDEAPVRQRHGAGQMRVGAENQLLLDVLRPGPLWSKYYDLKYPTMSSHDHHAALFTTEGGAKDAALINAFSEELGLNSALTAGVSALYGDAEARDKTQDISAVIEAILKSK